MNFSAKHKTFETQLIGNGLLFDLAGEQFPTRVYGWTPEGTPLPEESFRCGSSFFGFIHEGPVTLATGTSSAVLSAGQYFSTSRSFTIAGGKGLLVEAMKHRSMEMWGGPVEETGRLRYIDGCTDTLLLPPVKQGDPCLNALFFPPNVNQTQHTHPSFRIGFVLSGSGECVLPGENIPLASGQVFLLHPERPHCFRTSPGQGLTIVTYHPDSDYGPLDGDHPMINRTIVDGVSAARLPNIQTCD